MNTAHTLDEVTDAMVERAAFATFKQTFCYAGTDLEIPKRHWENNAHNYKRDARIALESLLTATPQNSRPGVTVPVAPHAANNAPTPVVHETAGTYPVFLVANGVATVAYTASATPSSIAVSAVVAALLETTRLPDGTFLPAHAEPWGIDVGLVNQAITVLTSVADSGEYVKVKRHHLRELAATMRIKENPCANTIRRWAEELQYMLDSNDTKHAPTSEGGKVIAVDPVAMASHVERVEREVTPFIREQAVRKAVGANALMQGNTSPESTAPADDEVKK